MCLSAILGIGSSLIGASSASKAAKSQERAAQNQLELQREIYDEQKERFQPFYDKGLDYAAARDYLLGMGPQPTVGGTAPEVTTREIEGKVLRHQGGRAEGLVYGRSPSRTEYLVGDQVFDTRSEADNWASKNKTGGTPYEGFQESPGYRFALEQGQNALQASAAAQGGLYSGKTMQALQDHGQGMANQEFNNYLAQITQGASQGQAAAAQTAQAAQNYAGGANNALAAQGNAAAAGAIGVGNALQGGINTGIGMWQYQQGLNNNQPKNSWWGS